MRALLIDHVFRADLMVWSLAINAVLFIASFAIFLALLTQRQARTAPCSGVANKSLFPVDFRGIWPFRPRRIYLIGALTHNYAFGTMLRRKRGDQKLNADW